MSKIDRRAIVKLARELRRPIATLLALAPVNDPFYAGGMPASLAAAEWFAEHYRACGFGNGCHLRRVHYWLVSQDPPPVMRDGTRYENTEECWQKLCVASKPARYLGLVPVDDFSDKRAPAPTRCLPEPVDEPALRVRCDAFSDFSLPLELPDPPDLFLRADPPTPFHLEIWCEKSTIDDVLKPLASQYGLNVVTGVGELSLSACRDLVERAEANGGRPVRILYVSDFDPGGQSMPLAVARKIEWRLDDLGVTLDVRLHPVALTYEQCLEYRLPRTPIKETERRGDHFEQRFGAGATELDALEALYPGELRKILVREIERFLDPSLRRRWLAARDQAQRALDEITDDVLSEYAEERGALEDRLVALREQIEGATQQLEADLSALNEAMRQDLERRAQPIIDGLAMPQSRRTDEWESPLFDSARDYVEQIDAYKAFQGKPTQRKKRGAAA